MIHCEFIALDILRYKSFIIYFYKTYYTDKKYTFTPISIPERVGTQFFLQINWRFRIFTQQLVVTPNKILNYTIIHRKIFNLNKVFIYLFFFSCIQLLRYAQVRIIPTTTASKQTGNSILFYQIKWSMTKPSSLLPARALRI